jgi:hypothetical protein
VSELIDRVKKTEFILACIYLVFKILTLGRRVNKVMSVGIV